MLKSNLLDGGSTNLRLSASAYDVLISDCHRFGYIKSGKPNISRFISKLAKELTDYRMDLHNDLLKDNGDDEALVRTIERGIFGVFCTKLNYICDDTYLDVGYRISKEFLPSLKFIFFEALEKFDMDFASYIRSIIHEYCSRSDGQRELFANYSLVKTIKKAIEGENVVRVVNEGVQDTMVFVALETDGCGYNYVLGVTKDRKMGLFLPMSNMEGLSILKERMAVTTDEYEKVVMAFNDYIEGADDVRV